LKAVRHHHEHYDGTGYPDGLKGEQIPQLARIIAVADTFDAMTSGRPYRKALTQEAACAEVERCRGTQFDPEVASAFLEIWRLAGKAV
jgi:HD-GYP domain-containing protein (c-di-GMP phosphodiesterase class II)